MKFQLKGSNNPLPHIKVDDSTKVTLFLYGGVKPLLFINKEGKVPLGNVYTLENGIVKNFPHTTLEEREVGTYRVDDDTYYFEIDLEKVV